MSATYVILYRINDGPIQAVVDDDDEISVFTFETSAAAYAMENKLFQSGQAEWQVVEFAPS